MLYIRNTFAFADAVTNLHLTLIIEKGLAELDKRDHYLLKRLDCSFLLETSF
jgi:hypothetical protein